MKVLLAIVAIGLLALYANADVSGAAPKVPFHADICKGQKLGKNMPYCYDGTCTRGDCTKFVVCIGGGVAKNCPKPTHFNAKLQVCDWPESANCELLL